MSNAAYAAGTIVAYELQTYGGGQWKIDSIFDDRTLALHEAQSLDRSGRHSGVRVIEEVFDPNEGETKVRTIFRGSRALDASQSALHKTIKNRRETTVSNREKKAAMPPRAQRQRPVPQKKKSGMIGVMLTGTGLAIVGVGAYVGLQFLQ